MLVYTGQIDSYYAQVRVRVGLGSGLGLGLGLANSNPNPNYAQLGMPKLEYRSLR